MSERIVFGGPSDVFPNKYPTHPSLVDLGHGEHSAHNPDYYHYSGLGGGVTFAQEMPASAQRGLAQNANEDMSEQFKQDKISKGKQPGAMGSYWVSGATRREMNDENENAKDNIRRGHQIYVGSSMKQKQKGEYEVGLESDLHEQLAGGNGELPDHRRHYQCAEPGLISEHRYENAWDNANHEAQNDRKKEDGKGGRFYVEDRKGHHLPPCGHGSEYGCADICAITGDRDISGDSY
jgi:hypothetical protein